VKPPYGIDLPDVDLPARSRSEKGKGLFVGRHFSPYLTLIHIILRLRILDPEIAIRIVYYLDILIIGDFYQT
jgi:hypothetical protein